MRTLQKILVANRGEIACRIIRTAKALGYKTVAVYSEADINAPHTKDADEAYCIGLAPVAESYLNIDTIIEVANSCAADAIHPGYGFLSENAKFAEACEAAGLTFVGPTARCIELMGNKAAAKRHMQKAGVPCVPGYEGKDQSEGAFVEAVSEIGFPVMVKAAAGGGGRGMRQVEALADLPAALEQARREAVNAFGSGELILEKAVQNPRHVEVQIFGDQQGNILHLGERDCSIQRRHQKIIEEAPCPVVSDVLRNAMGSAAVEAAKSINYVGAGTVEFLLDNEGCFYFLEMNTRLQVEHPVTEMVTGLDLVALQFAVAEGKALPFAQEDVRIEGHAIEARIYAEDPNQNFLPMTGKITDWRVSSFARTDSGVTKGQEITPFYDPMLAKVVVHGANREEARRRLVAALEQTVLFGVTHNIPFLKFCLEQDTYMEGKATTAFLAEHEVDPTCPSTRPDSKLLMAAAVLDHHLTQLKAVGKSLNVNSRLMNWYSASPLVTPFNYLAGAYRYELRVKPGSEMTYFVALDGVETAIDLLWLDGGMATIGIGGNKLDVYFHKESPASLSISVNGAYLHLENEVLHHASGNSEVASDGIVKSPMHGIVTRLHVEEGSEVEKGDCVAVLEAMKMQHQILTSVSGKVGAVKVIEGQQVMAKAELIEVEERSE